MTWAWLALTVMIISYGTANFLQAVAATRGKADTSVSLGLLVRLLQHKVYLAGLCFQALGTLAAFVSRRYLPLFLVQASVGAGIVLTALLGVAIFRWKLPRAEVALIGVVLGGVAVLVGAAAPGPATQLSGTWTAVLAGMVLAWIAAARFAARWEGAPGAVALGATAGAAFGSAAIASRLLASADSWNAFVTNPLLLVFLAHIVAGQLFISMAFQRGATTAASAAMNALAVIPPAIVGLLLLGDNIRGGWHIAAMAGFVATVSATIALGWFAQPQVHVRQTCSNKL